MASPPLSIRIPGALLALVDAEASRRSISRTDVILDALADQLAQHKPQPTPTAPQPRKPPPGAKVTSVGRPPVQAATEAPAQAEGKGRAARAAEAAGIMEWDPNAKRPQYRPAGLPAGVGKVKRR